MGLSPRNLWDMKRFYERYKTGDSMRVCQNRHILFFSNR
ncbi:hypothetical protein [Bacteroides graminisolvens]|nr:hypothetical protein [Bacteroides graminisolvens]